jgi:hypothetical protein
MNRNGSPDPSAVDRRGVRQRVGSGDAHVRLSAGSEPDR